MEFIIITGLSGSGKSQAINVLEDVGFFCIDNMPPQLIPKFAEICKENATIDKVAIVTDIRGGTFFLELKENIDSLKKGGVEVKVLFVSASHDVIRQRYKETRRKHPLLDIANGSIDKAIDAEMEILRPIEEIADYHVDTSLMTTTNLRETIRNFFIDNISETMLINIVSFGFKYGIPSEADLMFDMRCMPNPYYIQELKMKTGLDKEVRDFVMSHEVAVTYRAKLYDMLDFLIPQYITEGKAQLEIAIGCTGGRHRSVTFAEELYHHLQEKNYKVRILHRDVDRVKK